MYATVTTLLLGALTAVVYAAVTEPMELSWMFDFYTEDSILNQFSVYEQCETMHVKWSRSSATGPSATAPYLFQIYTTLYPYPFVIDVGDGPEFNWEIPFPPSTQFQICMFDANGYTGGCQSVVSVVPSTKDELSSTCSNDTLTFPDGPLDVDAYDSLGPLSWTGWPAQCTDLQLTPKSGTPPYTLTVALPLHPPYNATLEDMSSFNWTVALTWTMGFFVSIADSDHNMWSIGMLHSGQGSAWCMGENNVGVSAGAAAGAGVGGLVLGAIVVALLVRCGWRSKEAPSEADLFTGIEFPEPMLMAEGGISNVYVVHHDGGAAPVTVYNGANAHVLELPPQYASERGEPPDGRLRLVTQAEEGESAGRAVNWNETLQAPRRPTEARKPSRSRARKLKLSNGEAV